MGQDFQVLYIDDFDNAVTATTNGAPGQTIVLPPGWIAVTWTNYGNPNSPVNMGPLYYSSQANADAAQQKGQYP